MLFIKRSLTALVLFCILAVALFLLTSATLGGIAGARAVTAQHITGPAAYQVGQEAGQEMGRQYGTLILLFSVGVSAAVSSALSFSGALPWCRPAFVPPSLPGRFGRG